MPELLWKVLESLSECQGVVSEGCWLLGWLESSKRTWAKRCSRDWLALALDLALFLGSAKKRGILPSSPKSGVFPGFWGLLRLCLILRCSRCCSMLIFLCALCVAIVCFFLSFGCWCWGSIWLQSSVLELRMMLLLAFGLGSSIWASSSVVSLGLEVYMYMYMYLCIIIT